VPTAISGRWHSVVRPATPRRGRWCPFLISPMIRSRIISVLARKYSTVNHAAPEEAVKPYPLVLARGLLGCRSLRAGRKQRQNHNNTMAKALFITLFSSAPGKPASVRSARADPFALCPSIPLPTHPGILLSILTPGIVKSFLSWQVEQAWDDWMVWDAHKLLSMGREFAVVMTKGLESVLGRTVQ